MALCIYIICRWYAGFAPKFNYLVQILTNFWRFFRWFSRVSITSRWISQAETNTLDTAIYEYSFFDKKWDRKCIRVELSEHVVDAICPPKSKCVWNNIYMYIRIMHARHIFTRRPNQPNQIHDESHGERQHLIYTIWQYLWFWACILEEYVLYINTRRSPESEQMALGWGCCCCCWSWLLPTEFGKEVCKDDYWTFIYICVHKYLGRIFGVSVGWTSGIWKHLFGFEMQLNDALFYVAIWFTSTEKR